MGQKRGETSPSAKYVETPNNLLVESLMKSAAAPSHPTLPRRAATRTWAAPAREREPLASCPAGDARAGKAGRLVARDGGGRRYEGDVLAGRPHGWGREYGRAAPGGCESLVYEGEFASGERCGRGTAYYRAVGSGAERYVGQWRAGRRHGRGRYEYACGDVYEGEWRGNKWHGDGRLVRKSGDALVCRFVDGRRHGLGTLFCFAKGLKYVAEYVDDAAVAGTVLPIDSADLEPLAAYPAIAAARDAAAAAAAAATHKDEANAQAGAAAIDAEIEPRWMPPLELYEPSSVLARKFVAARSDALATSSSVNAAAAAGTLPARTLEALRLAFARVADAASGGVSSGGSALDRAAALAGLDPAAPTTAVLLAAARARATAAAADGDAAVVTLDDWLHAALHFRSPPLTADCALRQPGSNGTRVVVTCSSKHEDAAGDGSGNESGDGTALGPTEAETAPAVGDGAEESLPAEAEAEVEVAPAAVANSTDDGGSGGADERTGDENDRAA